MATKLDKTIRREIEIDGEPFTITISPDGFRLDQEAISLRRGTILEVPLGSATAARPPPCQSRPTSGKAAHDSAGLAPFPSELSFKYNITLDIRMQRSRKIALVGALLIPVVAGGFLLQSREQREGALLLEQVMSLVSDRYVDTLPTADVYREGGARSGATSSTIRTASCSRRRT